MAEVTRPGRRLTGADPLRILFWGTPAFALPSLRSVLQDHEVVGVVTQPDRPAGRGRALRSSLVKQEAVARGIPVLSPELPRGEAFLSQMAALAPDLSVVAAYGHILVTEVLDLPRLGSVNVHASLLPELRGAAPVNWAIARGHEVTGVTIMRMALRMDAGPIWLQREEPILPDDSASALTVRLADLGGQALREALDRLARGTLVEVEQDHERATFAPKVTREVARVDWTRPGSEVAAHIRGMDAVPGAWSELEGAPVKLFAARVSDEDPNEQAPGTVLRADAVVGLHVAAAAGSAVVVGEVQPPGKRRMPSGDWIRGRGVVSGQRLI